ncbi:TPA: hypothetical protein ACIAIE_004073 [Serratia fonticola]
MDIKKSILIFCEGPHDVAFMRRIFIDLIAASEFTGKFIDLPAPFQQIFQTAIEKHAELDLSLDMAHKFFLPDKILTKDDKYIILFNAGGNERCNRIKPFIQRLWDFTAAAETFPGNASSIIKEHKYIFISDADYKNHNQALSEISNNFSQIDDTQWIGEEWVKVENTFIATNEIQEHVAAFVWCSRDSGNGTLEDVLLECLHDNDDFTRANEIIRELHDWEIEHLDLERKIAEIARMYKATISLMGQRKKPGSSMSVIVGQSRIINQDNLVKSRTVNDLVRFINKFCFE